MARGLITFAEKVTAICIYLVGDDCEWIIRKSQHSDLKMLSSNQNAEIHNVTGMYPQGHKCIFRKTPDAFFLSEDLLSKEQLFYRNSSVLSISFTERKNNQFSSGFLSSHFPLITISRQRSDLWVLHILNKQFNPKGTGCKGIPCDHAVQCQTSYNHMYRRQITLQETRRSNTIHLACGFLGGEQVLLHGLVFGGIQTQSKRSPKGIFTFSRGFQCEPYQNLQLKHIRIILGQMQESSESCS